MQIDEFIFEYTESAQNDLNNLLNDKSKKVPRKAVHETKW